MKTETASVKETVLITGSTNGIGLHLAKEFARRGHPLVLVAPVESELQKVASELKTAGAVSVRIIAKDLEKSKGPQEIFDELSYDRIYVDILVNNAEFSHRGKFWEIPIEHDISMLRLNIEAVLRAVYHASKAFVLSLTEALATELADTGVTSTALCPGPTDTDLFETSGMLSARMFQKANLMAPQDVAKAGYEGVIAGDRVVVPGIANKIIVFSRRLLPEATMAKMNEKLYADTSDRTRKRGDGEVKTAQV